MILRKASLSDIPVLTQANVAMALETEDLSLDPEVVAKGVEAVLQDASKGFYLIAEQDGEPAGNLMVTYEWSDWRNAQMWWFQSVYVQPSFRGQRLFTKMYNHIKSMAEESGAKELRLYVDKGNVNAQKVYEKLGMEECHYYMYEVSL